MCVCTHVYLRMHICECVRIHICRCVFAQVCEYMYDVGRTMCTCTCEYMCIYMSSGVCVCLYMYACMYVYVPRAHICTSTSTNIFPYTIVQIYSRTRCVDHIHTYVRVPRIYMLNLLGKIYWRIFNSRENFLIWAFWRSWRCISRITGITTLPCSECRIHRSILEYHYTVIILIG